MTEKFDVVKKSAFYSQDETYNFQVVKFGNELRLISIFCVSAKV